MKNTIVTLILFCLISNLTYAQKNYNPGTYAFITVENLDNFARKNSPIVVKVADVVSKFKNYNKQRIGIFDGKKEIQTQFDDLNKDGTPDEMVFLLNLAPKEKVKLLVRMLPPNYQIKNYEKELFVELVKKEKIDNKDRLIMVEEASSDKDDMYEKLYHHGVAFETELIAYSLYFDKTHSIDIYGKTNHRLELPECKWYPNKTQLNLGFGSDILETTNNISIGTFKGWKNNQVVDFEQIGKRTQRIIVSGNIRNIVEIEVNDWIYSEKKIHAKIRYIQYARHRDLEAQIIFNKEFNDSLTFCTGIKKLQDEKYHTNNINLIGNWGKESFKINDKNYLEETVGLAVVIPPRYVQKITEDKKNHLVLIQNQGDSIIHYYLTATTLKEKKGYKSETDFFKYLESWQQEILNPISIQISEK
ncbi:MAG: DUF4861 family protein [Paludibacteraceae bacterium]|nr:DUF4861 family protein [Paludibacteraceae bacterium]MBN2788098.1 DUF4861 family protein [Paludibacteraceae bacterium]